MSNEHAERLKQVRERSESKKRVAGNFEWARVAVQEWKDIDFLLSLLDGQAAQLAHAEQRREEMAEDLAILRRKVDSQRDTATRMREACEAKVNNRIARLSRTGIATEQNTREITVLRELRGEIQSLTLDNVEQEK